MEEPKDRFNRTISLGDSVVWCSSEAKNHVYEVSDIESEDIVWISDNDSDVAVHACELTIVDEII